MVGHEDFERRHRDRQSYDSHEEVDRYHEPHRCDHGADVGADVHGVGQYQQRDQRVQDAPAEPEADDVRQTVLSHRPDPRHRLLHRDHHGQQVDRQPRQTQAIG